MDPYRIALVHGVDHPVAFHMVKKLLRGGRKGHDENTLVAELQCCLDRWKQLIEEDSEDGDDQDVLPFMKDNDA